MRKGLLIITAFLSVLSVQAQKDTVLLVNHFLPRSDARETPTANINIYPVPVRDNNFSIRTDRDMSLVKVTNMIGQDIYRAQYRNPLSYSHIILENPTRGIYLVTIAFTDGTRVVKKIMIENPQ
jgi:Secretion system C-terminal sorting domain